MSVNKELEKILFEINLREEEELFRKRLVKQRYRRLRMHKIENCLKTSFGNLCKKVFSQ
jgi:hypothetical protein